MAFKTSNLEELVSMLRIQIGDTGTSPTYSDELLHQILRNAVAALMRRWNERYALDTDGVVFRHTSETFQWSSPPVIQYGDRRAIVLQASIMIKTGNKFSNVESAVSWRDEEIFYSAVEAAKQRSSTLTDDVTELESILPAKRLARSKSNRLYGWTRDYE